ncbi:MAG TPA: hypothetical protein VKA44_02425, partial [Gemmatimonadota bacterium]|nr:hypothetical protein [Gemmatimonadota bacterium]
DHGHSGTFDLQANLARCNVLHFDGSGGSGLLDVSRSADGSTWTVSTNATNPTAYCASERGLVMVPFRLSVKLR